MIIPILLAAAFGLLVAGVTMPIVTVHTFLLLPEPKSILDVTLMLYESGDLLIAGIVGAFSLAFPTLKLALLLRLWHRLHKDLRAPVWLLHVLDVVTKWSMLDVLAAALLVAAVKANAFADARFESAAYLFVGSIALTYLCTVVLKRRAKRASTVDPAIRPTDLTEELRADVQLRIRER
jgi:paraquat-inducible protein A